MKRFVPALGRRHGCLAALLALSLVAAPSFAQKPKKGSKPLAPEPVATAVATAGPRSLADSLTGEAKAALESGKLLYGDGDVAGARVKFQAAYDASKDARLLWNIAVCEKGLRHYARVIDLVRQYLDRGGDLLNDSDRVEAKELLDAISSFTVELTLTVNEAGAELWVDGERVGSSPLNQAIVVDIGTREIAAQKPGFKAFRSTLPVGGQKQASFAVVLEREVHQGQLSVKATKDGSISIDGKPRGRGHWTGTLSSGGHTLRVEAEGMRPYQSEVLIQDDEQRGVDVVLEPVPIPAGAQRTETHGPLYDLELGLRTGFGFAKASNERCNAGACGSYERRDTRFIPLGLDIGYRIGRPTYLGLYGQYGWLDKTKTCGMVRHGAEPDDDLDAATRFGYTTCRMLKVGSGVVFHTLPRTIIDPYFGFDAGLQVTWGKYRSYDPTTGNTRDGDDTRVYFQPGLQLGIDLHPVPAVSVGMFTHLGPNFGSNKDNGNDKPSGDSGCSGPNPPLNCQPQNDCSAGTCTVADKSESAFILFGTRVAYTFP